LVLCEGPLDAVRLWQHGLSAVALMGKYVSRAKLAMLLRAKVSAITLMFDSDGPGRTAVQSVGPELASVFNVLVAELPDGVDPGSSTLEQAWDAYTSAKPFGGGASGRIALLKERLRKSKVLSKG
jgi:DNA primase